MNLQHYNHCHTFRFHLLIILLPHILCSTLSSKDLLSVESNQTIVSPNQVFELGFFRVSSNSGDGGRWYLGIWYRGVPARDHPYVWVANRNNPLYNPLGTSKITDSNLDLRDQFNKSVWCTNQTTSKTITPVVAELLDSGNFVLRYSTNKSSSNFLWQSFNFPTDTLLPEMYLGWDRKSGLNRTLISWASPQDPSSGQYTYGIDIGELPQRVIWKGDKIEHRVDFWNGVGSSGVPAEYQSENMRFNFTITDQQITYSFTVTAKSFYSVLVMSSTGTLNRLVRTSTREDWVLLWRAPNDTCDSFAFCGPYGYCDTNVQPVCKCIQGFKPRNQEAWMSGDHKDGCERETSLSCHGNDFHGLRKIKLPYTKEVTVHNTTGFKECQNKCVGNCKCTAFAYVHMWTGYGSSCLIWTTELVDIRSYTHHGHDLHVKLTYKDVGDGDGRSISEIIIGLIVGVIGMLVLCFVVFCLWKIKQKRAIARARARGTTRIDLPVAVVSSTRYVLGENDDMALPQIELRDVVFATEQFSNSNKLGEGGFGIVYKGKLPDGTLVAVKRLSQMSHQGANEFENEVRLIAKLQHINLVRLMGFCVEMGEYILIYEFLDNKSLDRYLFDKTESSKLNWAKRYDITKGIAQGIQYLHQESRFRIIHRDLKASNILLDIDMVPKISDFGMARIIGRDTTEANTGRVVGTLGYMAPEYWTDGIFSTKSDVFSFGVLVLEILSGKRNRGFKNSNEDTSLLTYVWRNWEEGNWLETIDPVIADLTSSSPSIKQQVLRCLQIGLLCVQERPFERPMMSAVVMMMGSDAAIPQPKASGYCAHCVRKRSFETGSSSTNQSWTTN